MWRGRNIINMTKSIEEVLNDFISHVKDLEKEDDPGGDGFWREFRQLREIQIANKNENKYPANKGKKDYNIKKNRYKDIVPFDSRRVVLKEIDGVEGSDYINASFIKDVDGKDGYIASQGPLPHTINDFWRMMWEYNTEIVFMACRTVEQGKPKCEKYWTEKGKPVEFGDITVSLELEEEIFKDFVERKLIAKRGDEVHEVKQFHYMGWPDHGVPDKPAEMHKMVGKMREERKRPDVPVVIHCSAGCGRTGTICAVDFAWSLLDQGKISRGFSMYDIILDIRLQRQSMVQTPDQYQLVHLVMKDLCEDWLNKFKEHDYANWGEIEYYNAEQTESGKHESPLSSNRSVLRPDPRSVSLDGAVEPNNSEKQNQVESDQKPKQNYENVEIVPVSKKPENAIPFQPLKHKTVIKISSSSKESKITTIRPTESNKANQQRAVSSPPESYQNIVTNHTANKQSTDESNNIYCDVETNKAEMTRRASSSGQHQGGKTKVFGQTSKDTGLPRARERKDECASYENFVLPQEMHLNNSYNTQYKRDTGLPRARERKDECASYENIVLPTEMHLNNTYNTQYKRDDISESTYNMIVQDDTWNLHDDISENTYGTIVKDHETWNVHVAKEDLVGHATSSNQQNDAPSLPERCYQEHEIHGNFKPELTSRPPSKKEPAPRKVPNPSPNSSLSHENVKPPITSMNPMHMDKGKALDVRSSQPVAAVHPPHSNMQTIQPGQVLSAQTRNVVRVVRGIFRGNQGPHRGEHYLVHSVGPARGRMVINNVDIGGFGNRIGTPRGGRAPPGTWTYRRNKHMTGDRH